MFDRKEQKIYRSSWENHNKHYDDLFSSLVKGWLTHTNCRNVECQAVNRNLYFQLFCLKHDSCTTPFTFWRHYLGLQQVGFTKAIWTFRPQNSEYAAQDMFPGKIFSHLAEISIVFSVWFDKWENGLYKTPFDSVNNKWVKLHSTNQSFCLYCTMVDQNENTPETWFSLLFGNLNYEYC